MKKQVNDIRRFVLFAVVAIAAGILYLAWGWNNTAATLYELGFLRYRAAETLTATESWNLPEELQSVAQADREAGARLAGEQETAEGTWRTESAGALFGEQALLELDYRMIGSSESGRTVILLHGFGESPEELSETYDLWLSQGWNILVPTLRGYADDPETNTVPTTFGVYEEFDLADLIRQTGLSEREVVVFGRGSGAAAAILAAANESLADAGIDGIIAECPYDNLGRLTESLLEDCFKLKNGMVYRFLKTKIRDHLGFEAGSVDLTSAAAVTEVPILILTSQEDAWIGPSRARAVYDGWAGEKSLCVLSGPYRGIRLTERAAYNEAVGEFLNNLG